MKKAVLISDGFDFTGAGPGSAALTPRPSLALLALGSYLAAHDVPVELVDPVMDLGVGLTGAAAREVHRRVVRHLQEQADAIAWVGISKTGDNSEGSLELAQEIARTLVHTPIVFGGYFPSFNYAHLLSEYPFITAVVRGDGEVAALHISQCLNDGRGFPAESIPNLAWLEDGELRASPVQHVPTETPPILDYRLLRSRGQYPIASILTSRGCPFHCSYCLEAGMRPYAGYPVEFVRRQLDHLESVVDTDRVFILDPIFGVGQERTRALCQVLRGRRFTYALESRADVLTPGNIRELREAGVELIYFGIESASPATLQRMGKANSQAHAERYIEQALETLTACFEAGLTPFFGMMLGYPGDIEDDYRASLRFVAEVARRHGKLSSSPESDPGFIAFVNTTLVYQGSLLFKQVAEGFPQEHLSCLGIGTQGIPFPSPGLGYERLAYYVDQIQSYTQWTPLASDRWCRFFLGPIPSFAAHHPELVDSDGVLVFGDSLLSAGPADFAPPAPPPPSPPTVPGKPTTGAAGRVRTCIRRLRRVAGRVRRRIRHLASPSS